MIPRKLHRVWLGDAPADDAYLGTWERFCPGWEVKTWGNADVAAIDVPYVREALSARKWAFASDYMRLLALYREGGFYMDTDVELSASLDRFLPDSFCVGVTPAKIPQTAFIGAEPGNEVVKEILDGYSASHFDLGSGVYDERPINLRFEAVLRRRGVDFGSLREDGVCEPEPGVKLYPSSLLCRREEGKPNVAIHHAAGTWLDPYKRKRVVDLPAGLRYIRMKRRKTAKAGDGLNLIEGESAVFSLRFGRVVLVLAKRGANA